MNKTLIIKTGATGDVVRTTPLLHVIEGEIHWLKLKYNKIILPIDCAGLTKVYSVEDDIEEVKKQSYTKIISLEEDRDVCSLIAKLKYNELAGIFIKDEIVQYTPDSAVLFDLSLISALGKTKADDLKFANTLSYQHLIFQLSGEVFTGQKYWINKPPLVAIKTGRKIGIESRAGDRWQGKIWFGYDTMAAQLKKSGYEIVFFTQKNSLKEYIADIAGCDYIITGDTLAMHVALAVEIPVIAIFTCTSPSEIFDYGMLKKIINPNLKNCFYSTSVKPEDSASIEVAEVLDCFQQWSNQHRIPTKVQ